MTKILHSSSDVIPAKAGIQYFYVVIPAKAGIQNFYVVIPAKAGIQRRRGGRGEFKIPLKSPFYERGMIIFTLTLPSPIKGEENL
jgi:hypothetical protein